MGHKRPGVMLYTRDIRSMLAQLSDEQAGMLFRAIIDYADDAQLPDMEQFDSAMLMAWAVLRGQIDDDAFKYEQICANRSKGRQNQLSRDKSVISDLSDFCDQHNTNYPNINLSCRHGPKEKRIYPPDSEPYKAAAWLRDSLVENFPAIPPKGEATVQAWADDFRLLHERDGYDWQLISDVLAWAVTDSFWRQNIRSGAKFRKQFEALLVKSEGKRDA